MIRALLLIVNAVRSVVFFETAAAGLLIAAAAVAWGLGAALAVGGVCAFLKSYDLDAG